MKFNGFNLKLFIFVKKKELSQLVRLQVAATQPS